MTPERRHEFDMMKGVAIFLVVAGHVILFDIGDYFDTWVMRLITNIHMPLFFFISGWFSYKMSADGRILKPRLWARFKQLMIPMCVVASLSIFRHWGTDMFMDHAYDLLFNPLKFGYWFPVTLFEITLLYALAVPLLNRLRGIRWEVGITLVIYVAIKLVDGTVTMNISHLFMLESLWMYWVCFMFGVIASGHEAGFMKIVKSSGWQTAALLAGTFGILYYSRVIQFTSIPQPAALWVASVTMIALRISTAIIAMRLFTSWAAAAYSGKTPGKWAAMWSYIGRRSFGIYLLHYIFLFPMPGVAEVLNHMEFAFIPTLAVSAITAAFIIAVVLGVMAILRPSRLLTWLLTGTLPSPSKPS